MAFGRKKKEDQGDEPEAGADAHASEEPATESAFAAPSSELSEATATAGDPAAAGVDAEGPGQDVRGDTSTYEVAAATDAPYVGPTEASGDPGAVGSVAASPDPVGVPAGYGGYDEPGASPGADHGDSDDGSGVAEKAGAMAAGAESVVESRPEVLVGAAFLGGIVFARILGALGGRS